MILSPRFVRIVAICQILVYSLCCAGGSLLQAHQAPPPAPTSAAGLATLQSEIDLLKTQVNTLTGNVAAVKSAGTPLVDTGRGIIGKITSFPDRVEAFRVRYGIPVKNPTIDQEWHGIKRYILERGGMSPSQAKVMAARMADTPVIEHLKRPFCPASIATVVGAVAAANVFNQMRSGEGVNVGEAVSFVREPTFWGGVVVSGLGYGVASYVASILLPPGMGVLAALIPTFAGMAASFVGWEIGSADGAPLSEVFAGIDFFELIGRAAGSSLGLILGGQMALALFGGMATVAGPLGAIVGAMVLGGVGARIMGFVKNLFAGDPDAVDAMKAEVGGVLGASRKMVERLGEAGLLPPAEEDSEDGSKASTLHAEYSRLYREFTAAQRQGNSELAVRLLAELRATRAEFQRLRRDSLARQK